MGILESCENGGQDPRMSISLDSSYFRNSASAGKFGADDFYFQESKVNLFGDIFYKKQGDKT